MKLLPLILLLCLSGHALTGAESDKIVLKFTDNTLKGTINLYSQITLKSLEGSLDKMPAVNINIHGNTSIDAQQATALIETALMINGVLIEAKPNSFSLKLNLNRYEGYEAELNRVFIERLKNSISRIDGKATYAIELHEDGLGSILDVVSKILNRPVVPSQDCPRFRESFSYSDISHLELLRVLDEILLKYDIVLIEIKESIFAIHYHARAYGGG